MCKRVKLPGPKVTGFVNGESALFSLRERTTCEGIGFITQIGVRITRGCKKLGRFKN